MKNTRHDELTKKSKYQWPKAINTQPNQQTHTNRTKLRNAIIQAQKETDSFQESKHKTPSRRQDNMNWPLTKAMSVREKIKEFNQK